MQYDLVRLVEVHHVHPVPLLVVLSRVLLFSCLVPVGVRVSVRVLVAILYHYVHLEPCFVSTLLLYPDASYEAC